MKKYFMLAVFVFIFAGEGVRAEDGNLPSAEVIKLIGDGNKLFREANTLSASNPESARDTYLKSALHFERAIRAGGIRNGKIFYNTGNAYFRAGDIGRAILNYRRAEDYIPNDASLRQNLEYARAKRADRIDPPQRKRVLETLFFWHYDIPGRTRSFIFGLCWTVFWFSALARLFARRSALNWISALTGILALLFLGSLMTDIVMEKKMMPGVIVEETVIARKGDGGAFEPSFREPLHAGAEFELLEKRHDWCQVALSDGRTCWLPAKSVEFVR